MIANAKKKRTHQQEQNKNEQKKNYTTNTIIDYEWVLILVLVRWFFFYCLPVVFIIYIENVLWHWNQKKVSNWKYSFHHMWQQLEINSLFFFFLSFTLLFFHCCWSACTWITKYIRSLARLCFISSNSIPAKQKSQERNKKKKDWIEERKKKNNTSKKKEIIKLAKLVEFTQFISLSIFFFFLFLLSSFGTCVFIIKIYTRRTIFYRNGIFFVREQKKEEKRRKKMKPTAKPKQRCDVRSALRNIIETTTRTKEKKRKEERYMYIVHAAHFN